MAGASGNVRAGRAFVEIMLDQTRFERGLKAAQSRLKSFGASVMSLGTKMLGIATLAATPLAFATKAFADFDDEMRTARAVTGAAEAEFKAMTETAEKLGREIDRNALARRQVDALEGLGVEALRDKFSELFGFQDAVARTGLDVGEDEGIGVAEGRDAASGRPALSTDTTPRTASRPAPPASRASLSCRRR